MALGTLLGQLQRVIRGRHVQAQPPQGALPAQAAVLGGLHLLTPAGELGLGSLCLLARLEEAALELLCLRVSLAMGVTRVTPLLPDDAAAQHVEPRQRLSRLPGGGRLRPNHLEARLDLRPQVLVPESVLR